MMWDASALQTETILSAARRQSERRRERAAPLPHTPFLIDLDTAFLILALRNSSNTANIIQNTNLEPMNNWAKIALDMKTEDSFLQHDQLLFYFVWQNDTPSEVVASVSSSLLLNGYYEVAAFAGFLWSPFGGSIYSSDLKAHVGLNVLEWWNSPPTKPLPQPAQRQDVLHLSVDGGWLLIGQTGDRASKDVAATFHVHYDLLRIPQGAAAVFEVFLDLFYTGSNGNVFVDHASTSNRIVLCPQVRLEFLTPQSSIAVS